MKFKGIVSLLLALCMLFGLQCISVFANNADDFDEELNIVKLFSTFNNFEGEEMTTEDNVNFVLRLNLEAGSYQFTVDENGTSLSHPTTVKDSTAKISAKGIKLSETVVARCTLLATGGVYTFEYNTENDLLNIKKSGESTPADGGDNLNIITNSSTLTAGIGDKVKYNIYLKADEAFEDIQAVINFDESKLALISTTTEESCPLLIETSFNSDISGLIAVNSSNLDGYDFKEEKLLINLEFTVVGTGEVYLDFIAQDMTVSGGEKSYYFLSKEVTKGADFREELALDIPVETTIATEATETTTSSTNPTETTVPSSADEVTTSTEPSETTAPASEFELGDVNRDNKLNIRDATLIQKVLAKLEQFDNEQLLLADYYTDGKVNIKDATQIQKKLANLI